MLRIRTFVSASLTAVTLTMLSFVAGCASAPLPPPMTPEEAALAAPPPPNPASRANDPAFNPSTDEYAFTQKEPAPTAAGRDAPIGTSMRADDSAKKTKQRVRPATP